MIPLNLRIIRWGKEDKTDKVSERMFDLIYTNKIDSLLKHSITLYSEILSNGSSKNLQVIAKN